jgi:endonuclease G
MRIISTCIAILIFFNTAHGQKWTVDTVIDQGIYQSFCCYKLKEPLYVTYVLSNGGGPCDRQARGFRFKDGGFRYCATSSDYRNSHFEKGHLANAEDFAFDCAAEERTFRYYNCVPQTRETNHGAWLQWETNIRQLSKKQKLFIVAGCIYGKKTIGVHKVAVPQYCYKIVLNANTRKILHCLLFPNDTSKSGREISLSELKRKLHYDLMPAAYWKRMTR